jgi:hypothetical protein
MLKKLETKPTMAPPIAKVGLLCVIASNPIPTRRRKIVGKAIRKEILPARMRKYASFDFFCAEVFRLVAIVLLYIV